MFPVRRGHVQCDQWENEVYDVLRGHVQYNRASHQLQRLPDRKTNHERDDGATVRSPTVCALSSSPRSPPRTIRPSSLSAALVPTATRCLLRVVSIVVRVVPIVPLEVDEDSAKSVECDHRGL